MIEITVFQPFGTFNTKCCSLDVTCEMFENPVQCPGKGRLNGPQFFSVRSKVLRSQYFPKSNGHTFRKGNNLVPFW